MNQLIGFSPLLFLGASVCSVHGALISFNSPDFANAGSTRDAWLASMGISTTLHQADFESGFADSQNISGVTGLFSGGLVISDTSGSDAALIRTGNVIGSSNPVGSFAVTHNEQQFLVLDFSASPVDYVSFRDIDTTTVSVVVNFVGGGSETFATETTAASGDSAEFVGIFRNDQPLIESIQLDASGDGVWGVDNIEYGVIPEPSGISLFLISLVGLGTRRRRS